jgi:serine/threonine protein kinase
MAEVYRARDVRLGRPVALKVVNEQLSSEPELLRRFEHEARLAGSLNHPNLITVYDVGQHAGSPFFVTELLQGETLRERLAREPIPLRTALDWVRRWRVAWPRRTHKESSTGTSSRATSSWATTGR